MTNPVPGGPTRNAQRLYRFLFHAAFDEVAKPSSPGRAAAQEFNSLDAQREAGEAFIVSQKSEGYWLSPITTATV